MDKATPQYITTDAVDYLETLREPAPPIAADCHAAAIERRWFDAAIDDFLRRESQALLQRSSFPPMRWWA